MARELNPELFGEPKKDNEQPMWPGAPTAKPKPADDAQWSEALHQIELVKRKMKEMETRIDMTNTRLTELVQATKNRLERVGTTTQRLEVMLREGLKDASEKHLGLSTRMNERKLADSKVQELVDRHQHIMQSFEMRMSQMQKIVAEQEMQLMGARAALQDSQREMARLKVSTKPSPY